MLASPLRFLSYLNRRVNYGHRVLSNNELAILGFHLRQNLWIEAGMDMMVIADDYALDLDTAMMVRREGLDGDQTPKDIFGSSLFGVGRNDFQTGSPRSSFPASRYTMALRFRMVR
jgi:hypothetical protein